ncbi:MAG TPA: formylglycine-generating enzyme family protein [Blastocatellia bacterium]|nr:formylglycine-generating enzyme family protein [Blastocatellia bacterium]
MLREKIKRPTIGLFVGVVASISFLTSYLVWGPKVAASQVEIVSKKPAAKPAAKSAAKPGSARKNNRASSSKQRPRPTPAAVSGQIPRSNLISSLDSPAELIARSRLMARSLTFIMLTPQLSIEPVAELKPAKAAAKSLPLPTLVSYVFDVMTIDYGSCRTARRTKSARYYTEDLSQGVQLQMVEIPDGTFQMGNRESDLEDIKRDYAIERELRGVLSRRLQWELPQHRVTVPAFYMGRYEITQAQWRTVAGLPRVNRTLTVDPSYFKGGDRPVEKVSWDDAMEFCERLSRATGRRYRLPTEAEWEYACRAGTNTQFHFGDTINTDWVNYFGKYNYGCGPKGDYRAQTAPVGQMGVANPFGLYDMHGNVWEWCLDTWHDSYRSAPADGSAWETGGIRYVRSLRGGGWDSVAGECRSFSRNRFAASLRLNDIGFRVVAEAGGPQTAFEALLVR